MKANPKPRRRASTSGTLVLYDGRDCVGRMIRRGADAIEAFDIEGKSLGIFRTLHAAAEALGKARTEADVT